MKIYLVRHAQSKRNANHDSEVDAELTEIGEEQARRLGSYFHRVKLNKIYCSPMKRARSTFNAIKPFVSKVPATFTREMVEMSLGKYGEGKKDDFSGYFKEAMNSGKPYHLHAPKGGESLQGGYDRAGKFYKKLLKNHKHSDKILLVGHGFFSLYLILNALGLDLFESKYYTLSNASVSTLDIDRKGKVKKFHINDYNQLIKEGLRSKK
ncbi:MAG: hypothetical protein CL811_04725 [Colwelliaceae bacterium]|nr:hypothetical protein [Colwelliaceae bacterium]|tara:strand:+ start:6344 stop:6970 length:627 start_codon:yes stop_codon:yes gene_type:complete